MPQRRFSHTQGFTLIELMIVVVIIGILAAIALPSYRDSIRKGRRADGQSALMQLQLAQEKWRGSHLAYTSTLTNLSVSSVSPDGYYAISINSADSAGYTAQAVGNSSQTADKASGTSCTTLTLTASGNTITHGPTVCWRK